MKFTAIQREVFDHLKQAAQADSLRVSALVRPLLRDACGTDEEVAQVYRQISHSEVTVNFDPSERVGRGTLVDALRRTDHWANYWEVPRKSFDPGRTYSEGRDRIEQAFGYPPFPAKASAADRIQRPRYGALNLFHAANGTWVTYGSAALVLSPGVRKASTLTCSDTFDRYFKRLRETGGAAEDADAPAAVGTFAYMDHQLLIWHDVLGHETVQPPITWIQWVQDLVRVAQGGLPLRSPPYWEVQVHGVIEFATDVTGLRADFGRFFGTPEGQSLRDWARKMKWFLTWGEFVSGRLILDPGARTGSLGGRRTVRDYANRFAQSWRACQQQGTANQWDVLWAHSPLAARYEPPRGGEPVAGAMHDLEAGLGADT